MKKTAIIILIVLCVLMASCGKQEYNEQNVNNTNHSIESEILEDNNHTDDSPEQDINNTNDFVESDVLEDNIHTEDTYDQNNSTVPYLVSFSSIDEMKNFLSISKESANKYDSYIQANKINTAITQIHAQNIAKNVENTDIPTLKNDLMADDFAATYYLDRNELDIIYKIDGIRYRFIYKFSEPNNQQRADTPVLKHQKLGSYVLDLYQGDGCLVGTVNSEFALIQIIVYDGQINSIDFSQFNMDTIAN